LEALLRSSAVKARYVVVGRRAVAPPPQQQEEEPESLYRRCKTFYVFLFLSLCISVFLFLSVFCYKRCLQCFDCWLGGRKGIRPVKTEWWAAGVVICLEQGADMHMAQLMPLPLTVSCFSKIQIGFTFLVLAYLGSPGKKGR